MKYIDIHHHANLAAFDEDYTEVVARAHSASVALINVGTDQQTSTRAIALLDEFPHDVYATVGLHPLHTSTSYHDPNEKAVDENTGEEFDYELYKKLASHPKVVAIGECGLDYFRTTDPEDHRRQRIAFEAQIALANELKKPLMLHVRSGSGGNAYKDAQDMLRAHARVLGNSHFFAGTLEDAKGYWDMGYSTSFTGVLTFTHQYDEIVQQAPKELLHAETDAPYATPVPHRGTRNEAVYVIEVVKKMAELRGVSEEVWAVQLLHNAQTLFNLPIS